MTIRSEINPLNKVIIHSPGNEHHFTLPENTFEWTEDEDGKMIHNPDYLLFDDLISPNKMKDEHCQLVDILRAFTGDKNTFQFRNLLTETIQSEDNKVELLEECIKQDRDLYGELFSFDKHQIIELDPSQFTDVILSGRLKNDHIHSILKWPLPNLIFTRDIAAMIGNTLLLTWAKRNVRKREMLLTQFLTTHHPLFEGISTFNFHQKNPDLSIEGGDIIIFDKDTVFMGLGERNSKDAIDAILPICFVEGFSHVIVVDLPKIRTIMHLDTIFSRISDSDILVYPPLFRQNEMKGQPILFYHIENSQSIYDVNPTHQSLENCLKDLGHDVNPVFCGGDEPIYQEREQWSDGANAFTLEPGKIISYARNHETLKKLEENNFSVIDANQFFMESETWLNFEGKLAISIDSAELPRGRGGPRCLTLPLDRS